MIISDQSNHKIDIEFFNNPETPDEEWREGIEITVFHLKGAEWSTKTTRLNRKTAEILYGAINKQWDLEGLG